MERKKEPQPIDVLEIFHILWKGKKTIAKVCLVAFVLSVVYVYSVPRGYEASVTLAPEVSSDASLAGNIGSLANMVGLNLGSGMNGDALYPEIYPDVLNSTQFLVSLFDVKVETSEGLRTTLYDYFYSGQKHPWWEQCFAGIRRFIKNLLPSEEGKKATDVVDPFWLTKEENDVCRAISSNISCVVDKKTSVITLGFSAQDPLVAACMTDSIKQKLQDFIIDYKTSKARNDLVYFERLLQESRKDYETAQHDYSEYCDTHKGTILQSYISQQDFLENQLQLAYTSYSQWMQQVQLAKAKVQEKTPSFTVVKSVTVPLRPSSPKRMLTVIGCVLLAIVGSSLYVYGKAQMSKEETDLGK